MRSDYLLVVDDVAAVGRFVVRGLDTFGMPVHLAAGPASALGIVQRQGRAPTVLITDVHLGTGDGRVLAAELRQLYPKMPVILMSGGFARGTIPTASGGGIQDFLEKPFTGDHLRTTVQGVLDRVTP